MGKKNTLNNPDDVRKAAAKAAKKAAKLQAEAAAAEARTRDEVIVPPTPIKERLDGVHKLLSQDKVAKILDVSPRTLEGWRFKKQGPRFVKIAGRVRYLARDMNAFIEELYGEDHDGGARLGAAS